MGESFPFLEINFLASYYARITNGRQGPVAMRRVVRVVALASFIGLVALCAIALSPKLSRMSVPPWLPPFQHATPCGSTLEDCYGYSHDPTTIVGDMLLLVSVAASVVVVLNWIRKWVFGTSSSYKNDLTNQY